MINVLKRTSVKGLAFLLAVVTLIGIVLPLSASAAALLPDMVLGSGEISEAEAYSAYIKMLDENGVVLTPEAQTSLLFEYDSATLSCKVIDEDTGTVQDVVYVDSDGVYHSYVLGYSTTLETVGLAGIIGSVASGVGGIFDIASEGFKFFTDNNLLMVMLSITFAGVALGFVVRAFRTSRK